MLSSGGNKDKGCRITCMSLDLANLNPAQLPYVATLIAINNITQGEWKSCILKSMKCRRMDKLRNRKYEM